MKVFYILALMAALIAPHKASSDPLPPRLQGLWVMPDCGAPEKMALHSQTHVLYLKENQAVLDVSAVTKTTPEYMVLQNGPLIYPVQIQDDGILTIGVLKRGAVLDDRLPWNALPLEQTKEYLHCDMAPPMPHDFAVKAMAALDVLEQACRYGTHEGCLRTVMKHFDEDNSQTISQDEAVRAVLVSLYLSPFLNYQPVSHQTVEQQLEKGFAVSVRFVTDVFKLIDADMSGDLSFNELDYAHAPLLPQVTEQPPFDAITKIMSRYTRLYQ